MAQYEMNWVEAPEVQPQDQDKACKQVYVWIVTNDKHVVVVSKDGEQWQLPGGKPDSDETFVQTAVREVEEETSIDLSLFKDDLQFVGYQTVKDLESAEPPYMQVRFLLELDVEASTLGFGPQKEDSQQPAEDIVRFVGAVTLDELVERMPWMEESPEFATVQSFITA